MLAPALLIEALHQRGERRGPAWPGLLAAAAPGCGLLAYLAFWWVREGEWLAPVRFQANWERTFSWPWSTLWNGTRDAFRYIDDVNGGYWLIDWLIVVPMLAASVYAVVRLRPSYGVYLWCSLAIPLTFVFEGRPLMSMPRFVLPLFPAFWGWCSASSGSASPGRGLGRCGRWPRDLLGAHGELVLHLLTRLLLARPGRHL